MSIVIVGGNDRMIRFYKDACEDFGCRAKVFTQMRDGLKNKIGSPDLIILFTGTVSHKMVQYTLEQARRSKAQVRRSHSSSLAALRSILSEHCGGEVNG